MSGKGVFGSVVKCVSNATQKEVAIKLIRNKDVYKLSGERELKVLREINENDPEGIYKE